jgi:hypothetical protein
MFKGRLMDSYQVTYWSCSNCGLLQTDPPYWLNEAYSSALSDLDTGAVERNLLYARVTSAVCGLMGIGPEQPCLDFGGGYGLFTRVMRDLGYDFRWFDVHGPNLFARGFEGKPEGNYTMVTAFELFEHLAEPDAILTALFQSSPQVVLASTLLYTKPDPSWWYLVPETGQHVCFFSDKTMRFLGARFGYEAICSCGGACTLFVKADAPLSRWKRALLHNVVRFSPWALRFTEKKYASRSQSDHAFLMAKSKDARR